MIVDFWGFLPWRQSRRSDGATSQVALRLLAGHSGFAFG